MFPQALFPQSLFPAAVFPKANGVAPPVPLPLYGGDSFLVPDPSDPFGEGETALVS